MSTQRSANSFRHLALSTALLVFVLGGTPAPTVAQAPAGTVAGQPPAEPGVADLSLAPATVDVKPVARDEEIRARLQRVLEATEWFTAPRVRVEEGVVFLDGRVATGELRTWAGDLARNTEGVVAVANRMAVIEPSIWDFGPAAAGLSTLWRDFVRALPFLAFGLLILAMSGIAAMLSARGTRFFLRPRIHAKLLRTVVAGAVSFVVFLLGIYIILRVFGLTQLALTVVGGTGLLGLVLGIAFRDITENFLASVFLSVQRPFETGDLIEVAEVTGYVQQLNMRTTVVMTFAGNVVQIPNATVYKSTVRNFTTNRNRREEFDIGIGYRDAISDAQEIAHRVLSEHPAVLKDPEPWVLVNSLGTSTVILRVYFWIDGSEHSWLKVRSSVIRMVKHEFQKNGISIPDSAREMVFPQGIPVTLVDRKPIAAGEGTGAPAVEKGGERQGAVSTTAEAGLSTEAGVIEEQARQARPRQPGENLLDDDSGDDEGGEKK